MTDFKSLTLTKLSHTFHFKYQEGDEDLMVVTLLEMVNNPLLPFDSWDASLLILELYKK